MEEPIVVSYEYTNNLYKAKNWLDSLPDPFAADFEVASKFTAKDKAMIKYRLDNFNLSNEERRIYTQQYYSDGLSHPSLTVITHLSVSLSDHEAYVIVCDNDRIRDLVYNFLITTLKKQIWHNAPFDFKRIRYRTGKIPLNFEDTMLLAKCLLNNCNSFLDRVSLKELMAYLFGDWAIAKEEFTLEEMWKETTLRYAATDSCATIRLYNDILEDLKKWKI